MGAENWHRELLTAIESLGRWFRGRHTLTAAADETAVPASSYLETDVLAPAIVASYDLGADFAFANSSDIRPETTGDDAEVDLRIAVSRFTRHHAAAVSGAAFTGLARGIVLDLDPASCRIISKGGVPFTLVLEGLRAVAHIPERFDPSWDIGATEAVGLAEGRRRVWRTLYGDHLGPLFTATRQVTRVGWRLLWSNAAEWVAMPSDSADEYLGAEEASLYVADRIEVLAQSELPGVAGPNPLAGLVEWDDVADPMFPHGIHVRSACCLTYRMPDRLGRLCANCGFLELEARHALVSERHGVPMGGPSGPAEDHARRKGLAMLAGGKPEAAPRP